MINCHITKPGHKLPCPAVKEQYCPFKDDDFIDTLRFYMQAVRLPAQLKFLVVTDGGNHIAHLDLADIACLFEEHDWVDAIARFLYFGKITIDRKLCQDMILARSKWWQKLAPLNYRWHGDPKEKPDRYSIMQKTLDTM